MHILEVWRVEIGDICKFQDRNVSKASSFDPGIPLEWNGNKAVATPYEVVGVCIKRPGDDDASDGELKRPGRL